MDVLLRQGQLDGLWIPRGSRVGSGWGGEGCVLQLSALNQQFKWSQVQKKNRKRGSQALSGDGQSLSQQGDRQTDSRMGQEWRRLLCGESSGGHAWWVCPALWVCLWEDSCDFLALFVCLVKAGWP